MKNNILVALVLFIFLSGVASFALNKSCASSKCKTAGCKAKAQASCVKAKCPAGKNCVKK
ncbi:MAG: hypothetical protein WC624_00615 [Candidatus Margulisiibacteriota bacterium]